MGDPAADTGRHWTASIRTLLLLAAGLAMIGALALADGFQGGGVSLPPPSTTPATKHAAAATPTTTPTTVPPSTPSTGRSQPVSLTIPAIDVSVSLSNLGLNADGTVQVPTDIHQPGWYDLGPTPGQIGSAVILGHVDGGTSIGVFYGLRTLAAGDPVSVVLADGDTARFEVDSVVEYTKTAFPAQQVYGSNGTSELQLVTCGGAFDHQTGSYLSNIVVYTSLMGVTAGGAAVAPTTTTGG